MTSKTAAQVMYLFEGTNREKEFIEKGHPDNWHYVVDEEELVAAINGLADTEIAVDIEASGLDFNRDRINGIGFSDGINAYYCGWDIFRTSEISEEFFNRPHIYHYGKFDLKFLYDQGLPLPKVFHDTLLLYFITMPERNRYALDVLVRDILNEDPGYKLKDPQDATNYELFSHCCGDVWYTKKLFDLQYPKLDKQRDLYEKECALAIVLMQVEHAGAPVDIALAEKLRKEYLEKVNTLEQKCFKLAGGEWNIKSLPTLKIKLQERGVKVKKELDKKTLQYYAGDELIDTVLEYRKAMKLLNTYISPIIEKSYKGRIYGTFNQDRAKTGRLSGKDPNLQNIDRELRNIFIAEPGKKLLICDYSQLELRFFAHYSGEPALLKAFNEGIDVHKYVASMMYKVPFEEVTKPQRRKAKCFHPDTEFLTPIGWKTIDDIGEYPILSATPINNDIKLKEGIHPPILTWEYPTNIIKQKANKLIHLQSENVNSKVTHDHRMLGYSVNGYAGVCIPTKLNTKRYVAHAGNMVGYKKKNIDWIRLAVAVQADGSYSGNIIKFGFRKRRKSRRLIKLMKACGFCISQKLYGKNYKYISFNIPKKYSDKIKKLLTKDKMFPWWWLSLTIDIKKAIIDEAKYWDACAITHRSYRYVSTKKQNIDVLQAIATSIGRKATLLKFRRPKNKKHNTVYSLSIFDRCYSRADSITAKEKEYNGQVVCLSVPTSFVVTRYKGKVLITGQCINFGIIYGMGSAALASVLKCSEDEAYRLRRKYLRIYKKVESFSEYASDAIKIRAKKAKTGIGWIKNIYNRVRYLPVNKSYVALNTVIQGSAGDFVKWKMIDVFNFLKPYNTEIILTVHDELVFVYDESENLKDKIIEIMEDYDTFSVPITVSSAIGDTWAAK